MIRDDFDRKPAGETIDAAVYSDVPVEPNLTDAECPGTESGPAVAFLRGVVVGAATVVGFALAALAVGALSR